MPAERDFFKRDRIYQRPILTIMIGFSRTGKSTYLRRQAILTGGPIVGGDDVRRHFGEEFNIETEPAVKELMIHIVEVLLIRGQHVTIDETNLTVMKRKVWLDLADKHKADVRFVLIAAPTDQVRHQWYDNARLDNYPVEVLLRQQSEFEMLTADERARGQLVVVPNKWETVYYGRQG
jgi:predicted kinase